MVDKPSERTGARTDERTGGLTIVCVSSRVVMAATRISTLDDAGQPADAQLLDVDILTSTTIVGIVYMWMYEDELHNQQNKVKSLNVDDV